MKLPPGFSPLTPYLFVAGAETYLRFLGAAFGAVETGRSRRPDGALANARVKIGEAMLMLSEAVPPFAPSAAAFYLYVEDAEAAMRRAVAAGADMVMEVADMPYGDRQGGVRDPAGSLWWISQRLTDAPYD